MNKSNIFFFLIINCILSNYNLVFSQQTELPSVFIEELTFVELESAIKHGTRTIIIPTGGTEQNGPHMVLGKHNFRVKYLAQKIATKLGDAVVAPTMAYVPQGKIDPPEGWMTFPGTISLPEEYYIKLLEFTAKSFKQHGFYDIVMIGDSGGNQDGMKAISEHLNSEWENSNVRVHYISKFYSAWDIVEKELISEGLDPKFLGWHAGLTDVSSLLAIDENLVRREILEQLTFSDKITREMGYNGDPSMATVKIGNRFNDAIVEESLKEIKFLKIENRK